MTKLTHYLLFDGSCAEAMKFYQPGKCIKFRSPMHRRANFAFCTWRVDSPVITDLVSNP